MRLRRQAVLASSCVRCRSEGVSGLYSSRNCWTCCSNSARFSEGRRGEWAVRPCLRLFCDDRFLPATVRGPVAGERRGWGFGTVGSALGSGTGSTYTTRTDGEADVDIVELLEI